MRGGVDSFAPSDSTDNLGFAAGAGYLVLPGDGTASGSQGNRNGTAGGSQGNKNLSIHAEYEVVSAVGGSQADGSLRGTAIGPWAAVLATYEADLTDHFQVSGSKHGLLRGPLRHYGRRQGHEWQHGRRLHGHGAPHQFRPRSGGRAARRLYVYRR